MKKVVIASMLVFASMVTTAVPRAFAAPQNSQSDQITIKDPAEYNAYTNAISQSTPAAKAAAIESFLKEYPNSVVKTEMLEQLVAAYQGTGSTTNTLGAAKRLLQVEPSNLRALTFVVYVEKAQANGDVAKLEDAAALAKQGLAATKPAGTSQQQFDQLKAVATPIFYNAIAAADLAKKDYKAEISDITAEFKAVPAGQTIKQPTLADTYYLGTAYVQEDPKDLVNGIWFLARAAQYLPEPYKSTAEKAAEYWYQKYHGSMDGFTAIQQLAHDNVFPPAAYKPTPAPPPPSPQQLAHNAVVSTPDLKTLALSDQEFILANGNTADADAVWAVLNGVTAQVPGTVISATADSVQLAVSDDAKQSQKADFTINMKPSLKVVPAPGANVTYIATFGSYTQKPFMIIMKDGTPPAPTKPVRHHPVRRRHAHRR
ncbi:MAG TPA: hypothetical protein VMU92_04905 [Acidobacteriaceae bacterium]|nr:hypothetical protein [Acidobacteriaceae bacterium]